jgi:septum formation protein
MPTLVLASTSPYRRELLTRLGIPFHAVAPACDEEQLKDPQLGPRMLAQVLAREKALSVVAEQPGRFVLGCDQLVELDGKVLGKPGTPERALQQLTQLSGRAHRLITAFALVTPDGTLDEHLDIHSLQMRKLSTDELARYAAHDKPFDCAGSYKIESQGIALFERIEGDDFTAITGLPLIALATRLRGYGFPVP